LKGRVILETKGLSKHFGGIKAIDNINLKLYKNEIIAIVGDNGAGKSTFIKTISGVYKKDGGEIYIAMVSKQFIRMVELYLYSMQHPIFF